MLPPPVLVGKFQHLFYSHRPLFFSRRTYILQYGPPNLSPIVVDLDFWVGSDSCLTKISGVSTSSGQLRFGADFWGTRMLRIMNHSGLALSILSKMRDIEYWYGQGSSSSHCLTYSDCCWPFSRPNYFFNKQNVRVPKQRVLSQRFYSVSSNGCFIESAVASSHRKNQQERFHSGNDEISSI
jgi:hypothetical protein